MLGQNRCPAPESNCGALSTVVQHRSSTAVLSTPEIQLGCYQHLSSAPQLNCGAIDTRAINFRVNPDYISLIIVNYYCVFV
jgi:hypothetical protein